MVMNEFTLGICYRVLHRMKLLRDIKARLFVFKHIHNTSKMTLSPLQSIDYSRMTCMRV